MNASIQLCLDRWNVWRKGSVNRRIFAAMMTVGGFTALVKLAAATKEVVTAYQFGTSDELDAFLIAFLLPQFAINLIGGSLNAALIPTYIQVREQEGQSAAQNLLSSLTFLTTSFLIAMSIALALTSSYLLPLVASGFSSGKLAVAQSLYCLLLPALVFNGVCTTWSAVLNAHDRFALAAAVPMSTSILMILSIIFMSKHWNGQALVIGVVAGALVEMAILGWELRRIGISLVPHWSGMTPAMKQVLGQYSPMVAAAFLMGGVTVVSQSMAAMLDPGSVSTLAYGNKVTNLILGIGAVAVSTAVLPHFSRMVATMDWRGIQYTLGTYTQLLLGITIPLTVALFYLSEPAVAIFFQRGKFTSDDTQLVAKVQAMYILQVPFYVLSMLYVRLIMALKANYIMLWGNIINLCVCVGLTYMLMRSYGVVGIALATSLMYMVSCCFLWWSSMRLMKGKVSEGLPVA